MLHIRHDLTAQSLAPKVRRMFGASAAKIRALDRSWEPSQGSPVFTAAGRYTSRGWTEWTQGFQFGSAILQFDATGDREFLESGRAQTVASWRRTSPTRASTITASTTSAPTAICCAS